MLNALIAALIITTLSLIGALFFTKKESSHQMNKAILPFAVGVFLGIVFFELIPETLELSPNYGTIVIVLGFLGFYLLSHILDTFHHHHKDDRDECRKNGAKKLLIGDTLHNIVDGVVIASAFAINPVVGIITTVGIALHEIPQEIAEFGVLIHAGYTRKKAMAYNFISASSVIFGVLGAYIFTQTFGSFLYILLGIAAGNLLYIASADLIPELHKSHHSHFRQSFLITILGVVLIFILTSFTRGI